MLLTVFHFTAAAQNADSIYKNKKLMDSLYKKMLKDHYVPDTIVYKNAQSYKRKGKGDSLYRSKDSLFFARRKVFDSTHKRAIAIRKNYDGYKDSAYKKQLYEVYRYDTLKRKTIMNRSSNDSIYAKRVILYRLSDSLKRMGNLGRLKYDSMKRLYTVDVSYDSMHRFKVARGIKLDSLRKVIYLQNIKTDSLRIKKYLQFKKMQLQKLQADTVVLKNGYRSRELAMEISCNPGDTVYINNNYKKVIIRVVPHQRLRLSTTINYREPLSLADGEILKKMGIALSRTYQSVIATVNGAKPPGYRDNNDRTGLADDLTCQELNAESNVKRSLLIELPDNVIIFLNTKYADANIENYVQYINAEILNGSLKMSSSAEAVIKSKYSTIKVDDIKKVDLNIFNSRFTGGSIIAMAIVSKSSTMQLDKCTTMKVASVSDEYNVEKAGSISGNKDFGKFYIESLKDQLVLSGANADVKINSVSLETPLIKIDSKYADLKVPVYDLKNYSICYEGSYKDVNKMSPTTLSANKTAGVFTGASAKQDSVAATSKTTGINKTKFEAKAGDISGKYTKVDIVCPFCNVVFN